MILAWLILIFFIGGLASWISGYWSDRLPRWISLIVMISHLFLLCLIWVRYLWSEPLAQGPWMAQLDVPWIPQWGVRLAMAMDGLGLLLILLSNFLGIMAVACSWTVIRTHVGFFHFNLMCILSALVGIFVAMDLVLFYFFWELVQVPLYLLIATWGHENRIYASIKMFLFTQASGLLMLACIIGLYYVHGESTGVYTFDYFQLLGTPMQPATAMLLMLGFFVAFAVKLPVVPLHTWLPDAHTEAPTAGSVDLAGLVLKIGGYGFLRFVIPLFPEAALGFAPVAMVLGVIGILYAAVVAFGQTDVKRLVAYTSVSHMGFVIIGIFSWDTLAMQGAIILMLAHGISTGALFIMVGDLQARLDTRDLRQMGGLWQTLPRLGGTGLFFALATMGLPGLANFVGEFLVLLGVYRVSVPIAVLASIGFIVSTVYSLWMIQAVFFGGMKPDRPLADSTPRELAIMVSMMAVTVWLGVYPHTVLKTSESAVAGLKRYAAERDAGVSLRASAAASAAQERERVRSVGGEVP